MGGRKKLEMEAKNVNSKKKVNRGEDQKLRRMKKQENETKKEGVCVRLVHSDPVSSL